MNVSLTPQLEKMIRDKVESGRYNNASEVVREGLRLIEERDRKLDWLRAEIAKGDAEHDAGMSFKVDDDYFNRVNREVKAELEQENLVTSQRDG